MIVLTGSATRVTERDALEKSAGKMTTGEQGSGRRKSHERIAAVGFDVLVFSVDSFVRVVCPKPGYDNEKGVRVHDAAKHHGLALWNDLLQNTRIGNSVSRDTNPDLTFTMGVTWAGKTKKGIAWLTEWKSLRDDLHVDTTISDIDEWLRNISDTAERHKNIYIDADTPAIHARLLNLWEARRGLLKRWKRQNLKKILQ
ncbi:hypothetical protein HPB50_003481 [Hyalomma asiaticum]|uniref:Uncharacterized protein n=1 Tax=Hyalomma asiaticum TaxID=266040 RepID=A0ACB7T4A0_HYAAI|nr:hypothetical protein HPB50_003481 [Hyalomma asiaticum]